MRRHSTSSVSALMRWIDADYIELQIPVLCPTEL